MGGEVGQLALQASWSHPHDHTVTTFTAKRPGGLGGPAVSKAGPSSRSPAEAWTLQVPADLGRLGSRGQ